jgi:intracellular multiplication protein IcmM
MSRAAWTLIRSSKQFNVQVYRKLGQILVVSLLLNLFMCFTAIYMFYKRPAHTYYASNGATPPSLLKSISAPNESSVALLATDPGSNIEVKPIPE